MDFRNRVQEALSVCFANGITSNNNTAILLGTHHLIYKLFFFAKKARLTF